ncbi:hypothetical protein AA0114_g12915 [Alternaria tenuissima]|uniref:4-hydroxyphenylpyruvate dioxygenase n=1 Tax=Alternaria tenuissima TaxID=119927 RepID=A0A4Q4LYW0_9PLEO|nr:hypothetical protein AA0114_g12915 [Alternaria tenuissima]
MSSPGGLVKVPINEPAAGLKKSQIEEFVTFYSGNSVQHIAFLTNDICATVLNLKQRSMQFITVPDNYYDTLRKRLAQTEKLHINKDLEQIKELRILVDFDKGSYLLQTFTKPLTDKPTVFLKIIQKNNFEGFSAGNFKSLFEAVEREQAEQGICRFLRLVGSFLITNSLLSQLVVVDRLR